MDRHDGKLIPVPMRDARADQGAGGPVAPGAMLGIDGRRARMHKDATRR
jgi:hypothetical protein